MERANAKKLDENVECKKLDGNVECKKLDEKPDINSWVKMSNAKKLVGKSWTNFWMQKKISLDEKIKCKIVIRKFGRKKQT
jgi:hypothetical protein